MAVGLGQFGLCCDMVARQQSRPGNREATGYLVSSRTAEAADAGAGIRRLFVRNRYEGIGVHWNVRGAPRFDCDLRHAQEFEVDNRRSAFLSRGRGASETRIGTD